MKLIAKYLILIQFISFGNIIELFAWERFVTSIDYSNFNNQNQILASIFKTDRFKLHNIGYKDWKFLNLSLGARINEVNKASLIYNFTFLTFDGMSPILDEMEDRPLHPGGRDYSFWNNVVGATILNIDATQFEKYKIQWIQFRFGWGFDTFSGDHRNEALTFDGFIEPKLGISSIELGENNFTNFENNKVFNSDVETGATIFFDLTYRHKYFLRIMSDYSAYISKNLLNKLSGGLTFDYYFKIPRKNDNSLYSDCKFTFGASYNKYILKNMRKEFLRLDLGANYYFTLELSRFLSQFVVDF
jgi:hypothetical protein